MEPVTFRPEMRVRRFTNIALPDGIDLSGLADSAVMDTFDVERFEQFWARSGSVAAVVGEPDPVIEFDLAVLGSSESVPRHHTIERVATDDAIVDGVCVWFDATFDDGTVLTTSPLMPNTSWGNRMYRLDREVARGETLGLRIDMERLVDASTWSVAQV